MRIRPAKLALLAIVPILAVASAARVSAQTPLTRVPGSPFALAGWGSNANIVLLSPDGSRLFVSNQDTDSITVASVAADGSLVTLGTYATSVWHSGWYATGMATNPSGDRLYVVCCDRSGSASVAALQVAADGSLAPLDEVPLPWPSLAQNGIVYVDQPGGGMVYVNNNVSPANSVSAFCVAADGRLAHLADYPTRGAGTAGPWAPRQLVASRPDGGYLYAADTATNDIAAFRIAADGTGDLTPLQGSPYSLPAGARTIGSLAVDGGASWLYTGLNGGRVARAAIGVDGRPCPFSVHPTGQWDDIHSVAVRPDGKFLVLLGSGNRIGVIGTDLMRPVVGSPVVGDGWWGAASVFDPAGNRLFVGNATAGTQVSVYDFIPQPTLPPLAITLAVDPSGTVSRSGVVTVTGRITSACPMGFDIAVYVRQRLGQSVVGASGMLQAIVTDINGSARWVWQGSSTTAAFGGGSVEVLAWVGASDPVTGEYVTAQARQVVRLRRVR